ncbi:hypothetical protein Rsub_09220 [Raphidocelis subcapitata]|uniref:Cytochrome b5 heme-binding domain-containing protein n=1 Tax=Raphidocelis subcapitata TaxID=307507 RepID=A0A2V0P991_9CHLO|nr:hypothetical protein Rsub_09220 [Raphidocelis subcapitata]|eukprot:GBF96421.1 hypothetical protein Rsub_09220 [Raphidocelis subcapitata]
MSEARQRRPGGAGLQQDEARPRPPPPPLAQPRGGGVLPLLGVLAVALLALRLGVRVVKLLKEHSAAAAAAAGGGKGGGLPLQQQPGGQVFTPQQLAAFDGAGGAPMYLSILGDVFDVSSKPEFYAADVQYHHFVAADGSRAFVTGEFDAEPREDVIDLPPEDVSAIVGWRKFYFETYPHKGRLSGLYYSPEGRPTALLSEVEARAEEGERVKARKAEEAKASLVPCGVKYTEAEGGKVWCEGEDLYPRKLLEGGEGAAASWRCICSKGIGWSDSLQIYDGCAPDARECVTSPPVA